MSFQYRYILFFLLFFSIALVPSIGFASPSIVTELSVETDIIQMINQTRANPIADLESKGLNGQVLKTRNKEIASLLENGMPELASNGNLYLSLAENLPETEKKSFLQQKGYFAETYTQAKSTVLFTNFIQTAKAAEILYKDLLNQELDPNTDLKILNPEFEHVAARFTSGTVTANNSNYNSYTLELVFTKSAVSKSAEVFFQLVNHARQYPLKYIDPECLDQITGQTDPQLNLILANGLNPLVMNQIVFSAAKDHGQDLLENNYFSEENSNFQSVTDRLFAVGYYPQTAEELLGILFSEEDITPEHAVQLIFESKLTKELGLEPESRTILNPNFTDTGIFFTSQSDTSINKGVPLSKHLLVADFGSSDVDVTATLLGTVWEDLNDNDRYDTGEGLRNIQVSIEGSGQEKTLFTNSAGGFASELDQGTYLVYIYCPDKTVKKTINVFHDAVALDVITTN